MAVPARRTSRTKKAMRTAHHKKTEPTYKVCPNCGETLKPHRACTNCGFYKGKEVIKVKEEN